tara:strand:- start:440 stop:814 length:375 start_codon:yes stop_codon:yes gene_type:complete
MTKKRDPFKGQYLDAPEKETLENKIIRKIRESGKVKPKKKLLGGLLTSGIKYAAKKYMKQSGKNISKLTKLQPTLTKNKRAAGKQDMATAIQMGGQKSMINPKGLTMKDLNKLQTYKNKLPRNY